MDKYFYIKKLFEDNEDKQSALSMSNYMRNMFEFYGISSPERKALYKDFIKEEKKNKSVDWEFLDKCYENDHREFQYFVLDYLNAFNKYITYYDIPKIKKYIQSKQWWDTIDCFDKMIGNIGLWDNRVDDLMLKWSKDKDMWLRRLAIDHQNGRKEKTNPPLLERILVNNFGSDEFFINKAIGWSLRDYSKIDPVWVRSFIDRHKDSMDKLSVKEASKYI